MSEEKQQWWGYKHISGTYQAKPYRELRDITEAQESDFCEHVVGPFPAANRDEALHMVQQLVNSLDTSVPTPTETNFYYCQIGSGGGFMTQLFRAIMNADITNQSKLALGFPEEVMVAQKYMHDMGYWENLVRRMQLNSK